MQSHVVISAFYIYKKAFDVVTTKSPRFTEREREAWGG